jgi:hypothetical protein
VFEPIIVDTSEDDPMLEDQNVDEDEIEDEMGEFEPMYPEES